MARTRTDVGTGHWYDFIYNTQIRPAEEGFVSDYESYLDLLDRGAQNRPSYMSTMQDLGLMGAGGKVDYGGLFDTDQLARAEQRGKESEALDLAELQKSAQQNAALAGVGGGTAATNSLAELGNTVSRNAVRDYADVYEGLADTAKTEAQTLGATEQADRLAQQTALEDAAGAQVDYSQMLLDSQTAGLLQDPESFLQLATIAGGLVTGNPLAGLSGLFTPKESNLKNYGITEDEYNYKPSEHYGMTYKEYQDYLKSAAGAEGVSPTDWSNYQSAMSGYTGLRPQTWR